MDTNLTPREVKPVTRIWGFDVLAVVSEEAPQHAAERRRQQAIVNLLQRKRAQDLRLRRRRDQREMAMERVEEARVRFVHLERAPVERAERGVRHVLVQALPKEARVLLGVDAADPPEKAP